MDELDVPNMEDMEVVVLSDDEVEVVLPPPNDDEQEDEEEEDLAPIVIDNVISSSSSPSKKYTLLETRLHPTTNLTDTPLNSVTFEDCHSLAEFYENCKNKREYPLSGIGSSITLCPTRSNADCDTNEDATKIPDNVTRFWFLCLRFFTKFGHHIASLEVKIKNGVEFPTMFWTVLTKMLRFLPNLRSLFIEASFLKFSHPSCGGNMLQPQLNAIDQMKCPSSLTKLNVLGVRFVEINILTEFMTSKLLEAYGTQLRKFSGTFHTFDMIGLGNLVRLRNLNELNLFWWRSEGQGEMMDEELREGLEMLRTKVLWKLDELRAPGLEKLRVMLNNTGFWTARHPNYLFKLLERFGRLKVLNLSGIQFDGDHPEGREMRRWEDMEGNGGLECLKFKDRRGLSYDFLEKLVGLEVLFIEGATEYWKMDKEGEEGMEGKEDKRVIKLQEYLYGKQVFKSNIWEKMGNLRMIGVQCEVKPGGNKGEGGGVEEMEEIYNRELYAREEEEDEEEDDDDDEEAELGFY